MSFYFRLSCALSIIDKLLAKTRTAVSSMKGGEALKRIEERKVGSVGGKVYRAEYRAAERGEACVKTWISPPSVPFPAGPDTHCGSLCRGCYTHFLSGQQRGALR